MSDYDNVQLEKINFIRRRVADFYHAFFLVECQELPDMKEREGMIQPRPNENHRII